MSDEPTYLELQARVGTTKHMGGQDSTEELIALCRIAPGMTVLDAGCGAGATPRYLASRRGCRVMAVDISPEMVELARGRAQRAGLGDLVEFRAADVRRLPFEDGLFDAVLCESVLAFLSEKGQAVRELARVAKPGARVGLNEETWLRAPPPARLVEFARRTWDIADELPTAQGWAALLWECGLSEVEARPLAYSPRREASQVRRYGWRDMLDMARRSLRLAFTSPAVRRRLRDARRAPPDLFDYLGYGLYAGTKPG